MVLVSTGWERAGSEKRQDLRKKQDLRKDRA
jgi:hypothetical protein